MRDPDRSFGRSVGPTLVIVLLFVTDQSEHVGSSVIVLDGVKGTHIKYIKGSQRLVLSSQTMNKHRVLTKA